MNDSARNHKKYKRMFHILLKIVPPFIKPIFGLTVDEMPKVDEPVLIVSNHTTNFDPIFVGMAFNRHTYFVATENVLRGKIGGWLLTHVFDPIIIVKGKKGLRTIAGMLKLLKEGENVAIFPEGNRSFDGETEHVSTATAKLLKKSGAGLYMMRIEGGFLTQPRFSFSRRKGKMHVSFRGFYSADELKTMTAEQIAEIMNEGIYENAYERQEQNPIPYKGKELAKGFETTIFCCPRCKKIGTLKGEGDTVACSCGYKLTYDVYGNLINEAGEKTNLLELNRWQKNYLTKWQLAEQEEKDAQKEQADNGPNIEMQSKEITYFSDTVEVNRIANHEVESIFLGKIEAVTGGARFIPNSELMAKPAIEERAAEETSAVKQITPEQVEGIAIYQRNVLTVNLRTGEQYEIHGGDSFNALKYYYFYKNLVKKEQEKEDGLLSS